MKVANRILLVITGSIASYRGVDLIRKLEASGFIVSVILTKGANNFITHGAIKALCKADVYDNNYEITSRQSAMLHINLARQHDIILIAPATANFIAKAAAGFADSLALETLLAFDKQVIIAPAMNPIMWKNPATEENLTKLINQGFSVVNPIEGIVACGEEGIGKYAGDEAILDVLNTLKTPKDLLGKTAIITLGSTLATIDPVRYISNYSTGEQGLAIAKAFHAHGCNIKLVCGRVDVEIPNYFNPIYVKTNQEMLDACLSLLPADLFFGCAAVCDYKIKEPFKAKIKKQDNAPLILELVQDIDVVATVSNLEEKRPHIMVGFALELQNQQSNAQKKLHSKKLDAIVLNGVEQLNDQYKDFSILLKDGTALSKHLSKDELAGELAKLAIFLSKA
jgi:phosphopantothenoylcysteine decarboxylase/phosphopantothenate--cysteine ligase